VRSGSFCSGHRSRVCHSDVRCLDRGRRVGACGNVEISVDYVEIPKARRAAETIARPSAAPAFPQPVGGTRRGTPPLLAAGRARLQPCYRPDTCCSTVHAPGTVVEATRGWSPRRPRAHRPSDAVAELDASGWPQAAATTAGGPTMPTHVEQTAQCVHAEPGTERGPPFLYRVILNIALGTLPSVPRARQTERLLTVPSREHVTRALGRVQVCGRRCRFPCRLSRFRVRRDPRRYALRPR
jgi:hypothetical protein